ncbi:hypothetical protein [Polyangium sp. 15x6]|uniref:alpha/beta fold hydrolase n=1 Tax=Polyangium sp. 15x6 TaxID=3042687 RepID=UPI00249BA747|nr:hypothetical protein [Polyangium sp. 15x6]MDI3283871.1 hypothetical protein [Polyangium sp. 15x6]
MSTEKAAAAAEPRAFVHPAGRLHDVGGHRLWVEQAGKGETVVLLAGLGPAGLLAQALAFAPSAEFRVLERSGSFGHVEEPDEVLRILRDFWARTSALRLA